MVALLSLEETFTYSGYSILPSTIILAGMARRVDGHMMNEGQGNFGASGLMVRSIIFRSLECFLTDRELTFLGRIGLLEQLSEEMPWKT